MVNTLFLKAPLVNFLWILLRSFDQVKLTKRRHEILCQQAYLSPIKSGGVEDEKQNTLYKDKQKQTKQVLNKQILTQKVLKVYNSKI